MLAVVVASVPAGALAAAIIKRANMYLVGAGLLGLGTVTGTACGASLPFTPVVAGAACAISLAASLAGSLYAVIAGATGNSVVSDMRIHQHITQPCADGQKLLHCLAGQHRGEPLHFANHTVDGGVFDLFYHKDGNRHVLSTKEQDKEGAHDKRREGVESDVNGSDVYMGEWGQCWLPPDSTTAHLFLRRQESPLTTTMLVMSEPSLRATRVLSTRSPTTWTRSRMPSSSE